MSFVLVGSNLPDRTPVTSNRVHRADDGRIYLPCDFMYGDATCLNDCVTFIKYMNNLCAGTSDFEKQTVQLYCIRCYFMQCVHNVY